MQALVSSYARPNAKFGVGNGDPLISAKNVTKIFLAWRIAELKYFSSINHSEIHQTIISPSSGPATGSFNGLHLNSKFLAISAPQGRDCGTREMKKILPHNTLLSLIRRRPDPTEPSDLEESPAKKLDCLPKLRSVKGSISADGLDVVGSLQE